MITIKVSGRTEIEHALDQWAEGIRVPRQLFVNLVSDVIAPDLERRFSAQGPGWRPLSPAYAAWKQIHFPGKPILERSGKLRQALTDRSRFGGAQSGTSGNTLNLAPKDVDYFAFHQQGGRRLPRRQMIDLAELEGPIGAYIEHWLTQRAREFGLVHG